MNCRGVTTAAQIADVVAYIQSANGNTSGTPTPTPTPTPSGDRTASLNLQSNAAGAHSVALSGTSVTDTNGLIQLSQKGLVISKITVEDNGTQSQILIKNTSNVSIKVSQITFLVGKNYSIQDQCSGKTLSPGKTCQIEIQLKGSKDGYVKTDDSSTHDELVITTDAGATTSVAIDLQPAAATTTPSVVDTATPKAGGGCTIGGDDQFDASQIAMLLAAAGVLISRRRKTMAKHKR